MFAITTNSLCVLPHRQRDRKADSEPVFDKFADLVDHRSVSMADGGERQHDEMHEPVYQGAEDHAAHDRAFD